MRSNEVFARMSREDALWFLEQLRQESSGAAQVALAAAAEAFRLRPQFLRAQPRPRQAEWMRQALSRPRTAPVAEEVLAEYFLGSQKALLTELLDALGLEHEDGKLRGEKPECPPRAKLVDVVQRFRAGSEPRRRNLLLRAFAAQSAVDWPELEQLLDAGE